MQLASPCPSIGQHLAHAPSGVHATKRRNEYKKERDPRVLQFCHTLAPEADRWPRLESKRLRTRIQQLPSSIVDPV